MFANIRYPWTYGQDWWTGTILRIRSFWSDQGPAGDCFWWMDALYLLGGIQGHVAASWAHERKVFIVCQTLFAINVVVFFLQFYTALTDNDADVSLVILETTKIMCIIISCLRMVAAGIFIEPITTLRRFVTSTYRYSKDRAYDEQEQRKFNRVARKVLQIIFSWIVIDTIVFTFPNATKNDLFKFPLQWGWIGNKTTRLYIYLVVGSIPGSILPKTIGCTVYLGVILMGMRTKLRSLAHRFQQILQQPVSNDDQQYFACLQREVREALLQYLEYWSHLKILKSLVGKVFLLVHYFSIFAIAALIYACFGMGMNFMTLIFGAAVTFFLFEYFLLCNLVDSFRDEADSIGQHIFEICARIPFRPGRRSEYIQLRTTLMIICINTRNGIHMDCVGLFEINTPKFLALLNIAYSVLTFLTQVG